MFAAGDAAEDRLYCSALRAPSRPLP